MFVGFLWYEKGLAMWYFQHLHILVCVRVCVMRSAEVSLQLKPRTPLEKLHV